VPIPATTNGARTALSGSIPLRQAPLPISRRRGQRQQESSRRSFQTGLRPYRRHRRRCRPRYPRLSPDCAGHPQEFPPRPCQRGLRRHRPPWYICRRRHAKQRLCRGAHTERYHSRCNLSQLMGGVHTALTSVNPTEPDRFAYVQAYKLSGPRASTRTRC